MSRSDHKFTLKGVYFHDGFDADAKAHPPLYWGAEEWRRQVNWLNSLGINAVEFATMFQFNRVPSTDLERKKISDRLMILDLVHSYGMKFGYLLSNTTVSMVPDGVDPGDQNAGGAKELCPRIPGNFEKTVAIQEWYLTTYKDADFFEEFAADWGGCTCGRCGVPEYMRYVRTFAEKLAVLNPEAKLYADTWCISYWGEDPIPHGWKRVFDGEIEGSKRVIAAMDDVPSNVHFALPCHHLYRPLAFDSYGGKKHTPVFPTAEDIVSIRRAGKDVLAWPHFVMDDDTGRAPAWGLVHSEVRYVRDLLQSLRAADIVGVMCNLYLPYLQVSNTYAYARLLDDPDADPQTLIADFCKLAAHPDDAGKLAQVMTWLENNSYWQIQMPDDGRLQNLPCSLSKSEAQALASEIRPNPEPVLPLPITPAEWLDALRDSIGRMDWVGD